jgi:precorrin-3B C17-methyltransferase
MKTRRIPDDQTPRGFPEKNGQAACLSVVGLGPGDTACLTAEAEAGIRAAEAVIGYGPYLKFIPPAWLEDKTVVSGRMRDEVGRCKTAIRSALDGKKTVLVCSGDPGVYALAGLVLELVEAWDLAKILPVAILPGVPAVCAAAALLGAPLTHDFACVSLSDLLTPWEVIERRVTAALDGDFVLAAYNPRSRGRNWQFEKILEMVRKTRGDKCVTGVVRTGYRSSMTVWAGTLDEVEVETVDMVSIVLFGSRSTRLLGGRMVTPRGYFDTPNPGSAPADPADA